MRKEELKLVSLKEKKLKGTFVQIVHHLRRPYIYVEKEIIDYLKEQKVDFVYYQNVLCTYGNCDSDKWALMPYVE